MIINNRFAGLICSEPPVDEENESVTESPSTSSRQKTNNKQPNVVPPNFPEKGHSYSRKTAPGNSSYANIVKNGKSIFIVGDSILGRLRNAEFNKCLKDLDLDATSKKKFFPGATAKEVRHYIEPTLEELTPDALVIHVGTNNLQRKDYDSRRLCEEIIGIGNDAAQNGVNDIFISSIATRRDSYLQRRCQEVNNLLKIRCSELGFIFIDNSSISIEHICDDGVHLLESGLTILANNYLCSLLHFLR